MNSESATDLFLRRTLHLVLIVLAALCCYFLWQISGTAREIHRLVSSNSDDIGQIVSTASEISKEVDEIRAHVSRLEEKVRESLPLEEMDSLLEETRLLFSPNEETKDTEDLSTVSMNQIESLLRIIRKSGHRFRFGDRSFSSFSFYLLLKSKYGIHKKLLTSSEDFIEKVATQTVTGKPYEVLFEDGSTKNLADWLREQMETDGSKGTKP